MKRTSERHRLSRRSCLVDGPTPDSSDATKDSSDDSLQAAPASGSSGRSGASQERQLYCLARVEEDGPGQRLFRPATDADIDRLTKLLSVDLEEMTEPGLTKLLSCPPFSRSGSFDGTAGGSHSRSSADELLKCEPSLQSELDPRARTLAVLEAAQQPGFSPVRFGGPCMHCAVADSPQWRRGPADKPILCNACGTRFRRTNQLAGSGAVTAMEAGIGAAAVAAAAGGKKRAAPPSGDKAGRKSVRA